MDGVVPIKFHAFSVRCRHLESGAAIPSIGGVRAGGKTPVPRSEGATRMLRGLVLRMGKIFWGRVDV